MTLPRIIAHRGAAASAPENTLASFRRAAALGARWVELDVQLSADKVPVVFHDLRLGRTSNGRGAVCRRTLSELKRCDAGSWFAPRFAGETIPTLAEALDEIARLGLGVNIEIKPARGQEHDTARRALRVAAEVWPDGAPPPLLSSFSRRSLAALEDMPAGWRRGLLSWRLPRDWRDAAKILGCATVNLDHNKLTPTQVSAVREAGLEVLAYTVNSAGRARQLWDWGVGAVFSDAPEDLLPVL